MTGLLGLRKNPGGIFMISSIVLAIGGVLLLVMGVKLPSDEGGTFFASGMVLLVMAAAIVIEGAYRWTKTSAKRQNEEAVGAEAVGAEAVDAEFEEVEK